MMNLPIRRVAARLVAGCAIILVGCSDVTGIPTPVSSLQPGGGTPAAMAQDIRAAMAAQERHTEALMRRPGVLGTAVGLLPNGRAAVRVFVLDATPREIPPALDNIPVDVRVTGRLDALSDPKVRLRPAPVGFSVGHPLITAGTIGARVVNSSGQPFVLSNNHVLAASNEGSIGDPILQPGPFDGGTSSDQIATLAAFRTIDFSGASNVMDAAIALSDVTVLGNATPTDDGYGLPGSRVFGDADANGVFDDKTQLLGLAVMKYGRTTKLTRGTITGINATVDICYEVLVIFCVKSARFADQVVIGQSGFSGGGDSGSLIVADNADRDPVGLLFAGSSTETIANRIDLVLNHFGVTVDGSASEPPPPPDPIVDAQMVGINAQSSIEQGRTVFVGAVVRNIGNQPIGAFDVTMVDQTAGVTIGTATVASLDVGVTESVTFSWNTSESSIGAHTLVASHNLTDDNAGNNTVSRTVQITAPATPVTDVAVATIGAPASAVRGATVQVDVTVRNVGNQAVGAFEVSLLDQTDDVSLGTQTISDLAAGAATTRTFSWNTSASSLGAHTLVATHTLIDDDAGNNSASTTVQVDAADPAVVHVGDLDGTAERNGSGWSATVEVSVHDASHNPLNGATVVGTWSVSGLNSDTCTTGELGGNGTCIMLFPSLKRSVRSISFTVNGVTMSGRTYTPAQNHDPDGSSNGTTQTVNRP